VNIDIENLRELLILLREHSVTEFSQDEVHVVLGPVDPAGVAAVVPVAKQPETRRSMYQQVFRGSTPSFETYRDAGLPIAEG
jgi:hypothetical protein